MSASGVLQKVFNDVQRFADTSCFRLFRQKI
jgi:hypothetical protein